MGAETLPEHLHLAPSVGAELPLLHEILPTGASTSVRYSMSGSWPPMNPSRFGDSFHHFSNTLADFPHSAQHYGDNTWRCWESDMAAIEAHSPLTSWCGAKARTFLHPEYHHGSSNCLGAPCSFIPIVLQNRLPLPGRVVDTVMASFLSQSWAGRLPGAINASMVVWKDD
ncbi:hypothetical protein BSKO_11902 [Bryopsis sp. KO-2023]|nr:hypothetical protein BSKO_11902 [Bryopsis sp. KO-2023]